MGASHHLKPSVDERLSASWNFPLDPTRDSANGPHWGLCPQTPVIGSCSALAMVPTENPGCAPVHHLI